MNLSPDHKNAAALLKRALQLATDSGLFDELAGFVNPDVINGFCDGFGRLVDGQDLSGATDQEQIEHWNSPAYGGDGSQHQGVSFTAEVVDMRAGSGQLLVNIGDNNGDVDDVLCGAFEITTPPGSNAPALMVYTGDEVVARLFRQPNGHLIEIMRPGAQVVPTTLPNGERAWMLLDS